MPKSKRECKDGKVPEGKNGRCIKIKSKTCKPGKAPKGKNGRCITVRRKYVRKIVKPVSPVASSPSPVARSPSPVVNIPSVASSVSDSKFESARSTAPPTHEISRYQARQHINEYMDNISNPEFLSKKEVETLAEIAFKKQLTESQIYTALGEYHSGRGAFRETVSNKKSKTASKESSVTPEPLWYM